MKVPRGSVKIVAVLVCLVLTLSFFLNLRFLPKYVIEVDDQKRYVTTNLSDRSVAKSLPNQSIPHLLRIWNTDGINSVRFYHEFIEGYYTISRDFGDSPSSPILKSADPIDQQTYFNSITRNLRFAHQYSWN